MKHYLTICMAIVLLIISKNAQAQSTDTIIIGRSPQFSKTVMLYKITEQTIKVSKSKTVDMEYRLLDKEDKVKVATVTNSEIDSIVKVFVSELLLGDSFYVNQESSTPEVLAMWETPTTNFKTNKPEIFIKVSIPGQPPLPEEEQKPSAGKNETTVRSKHFGRVCFMKKSDYVAMRAIYNINRFSVSVLSLPFKYRFKTNKYAANFTGEASFSAALAIRLTGANNRFNNNLFAVLGAGITLLNSKGLDSTAGSYTQLGSNSAALNIPIGVVLKLKNAQIGLFSGVDLGPADYPYSGKPFFSIGIGYSFLQFGKPKDQN